MEPCLKCLFLCNYNLFASFFNKCLRILPGRRQTSWLFASVAIKLKAETASIWQLEPGLALNPEPPQV